MRRWFGRRSEPPPGDSEAAILDLLQGDWTCACCGNRFSGVMELAARSPDPWPHAREYEPNAALRLDDDFLSEDFCVLDGKHFFVRSVLNIPVHGLGQPWGFGCWSTLSRGNFDKYVDGFDTGEFADEGPWFGWLCNQLKGYFEQPDPIGLDVVPQPGRQRPLLFVQDEQHPLAIAQRDGICPSDLLTLLRANGHGPTLQ